jgi:hypothetical protein
MRLQRHSESFNEQRKAELFYDGYERLKPLVELVVIGSQCGALVQAFDKGFSVFHLQGELDSILYRNILDSANSSSASPFYGYVNGDVLFDDMAVASLQHILDATTTFGRKGVAIVGKRTNVDIPDDVLRRRDVLDTLMQSTVPPQFSPKLFNGDAMDYYIFSRDVPVVWPALPPFLVRSLTAVVWCFSACSHFQPLLPFPLPAIRFDRLEE